jgi:hypothetical protein
VGRLERLLGAGVSGVGAEHTGRGTGKRHLRFHPRLVFSPAKDTIRARKIIDNNLNLGLKATRTPVKLGP